MLNIVLFGPPGAGKGTQAQFLIEKFQLVHLSTGDLFRKNIKESTKLGILAKSYMDRGQLVPDQVTVDMLKETVLENVKKGVNGFIFDGYPRNTHQAEVLDTFLIQENIPLSLALALEVEDEVLVQRILERGKTSGRIDDQNEKTIRERISVYYSNTAVLKDFYQKQEKLTTINGRGTIEEIASQLEKAVVAMTQ
ncbi:MAG: adenylate kinase [Flavobacteriales bacterium]